MSLIVEPYEPREQQAAWVELRLRRAGGDEIRHLLEGPLMGTVEAGRLLGDWLLLSEALSDRRHRVVGQRLREGHLAERVVLGEIPRERGSRSQVSLDGLACRARDSVFVVVSIEDLTKKAGEERALVVLTPKRQALVPLGASEALSLSPACRDDGMVFTTTSDDGVVQTNCTADGCRQSRAPLPLGLDTRNAASLGDKVLLVHGERPVTMRFATHDQLANSPAVPIYEPDESETVYGTHIFARSEAAVALIRTSRGAIAIRIDPTGGISPVRPARRQSP